MRIFAVVCPGGNKVSGQGGSSEVPKRGLLQRTCAGGTGEELDGPFREVKEGDAQTLLDEY